MNIIGFETKPNRVSEYIYIPRTAEWPLFEIWHACLQHSSPLYIIYYSMGPTRAACKLFKLYIYIITDIYMYRWCGLTPPSRFHVRHNKYQAIAAVIADPTFAKVGTLFYMFPSIYTYPYMYLYIVSIHAYFLLILLSLQYLILSVFAIHTNVLQRFACQNV